MQQSPPTYRQLHKALTRVDDFLETKVTKEETKQHPLRHGTAAACHLGTTMLNIHAQLSLPGVDFGNANAIDSLDVPTWARTPFTGDADCKDPAVKRGHIPAKNDQKASTGLVDELHFGVAASLNLEADIPRCILAVELATPNTGRIPAAFRIMDNLAELGHPIGTVIADRGYSAAKLEKFALELLKRGIDKVIDQPSGTTGHAISYHDGVMITDGTLLCPCTPTDLVELPFVPKGVSVQIRRKINTQYDERDKYAFGTRQALTPNGDTRFECPARRGTVRCPRWEPSMRGSLNKPTVQPHGPAPKCCTQRTVTIAPTVAAKHRQKYHYGTTAWDRAYGKRNRVESANAAARVELGEIEHGSVRTFKRPIAALWFAMRALDVNDDAYDHYRQREAYWASDEPLRLTGT